MTAEITFDTAPILLFFYLYFLFYYFFLMLVLLRRTSFLDTFYVLYFSHCLHVTFTGLCPLCGYSERVHEPFHRLYAVSNNSFLFIQKNYYNRVESFFYLMLDSIRRDSSDTSYEADALPPSHHGRIYYLYFLYFYIFIFYCVELFFKVDKNSKNQFQELRNLIGEVLGKVIWTEFGKKIFGNFTPHGKIYSHPIFHHLQI